MKNTFAILFSLIIHQATHAQTYVSGGIFTNTTWTLAGSPYIIPDTVIVLQNVTLTIEPGVIVKLDSQAYFEVRGSIISRGIITDSIKFTSLYPPNTLVQYRWTLYINATLGGSGDFKYSIFEYAAEAIGLGFGTNGGPLTIRNCLFANNADAIYYGMAWITTIDSCTFINNNRAVIAGNNIISHSLFIANELAVGTGSDVYNCTFCGNGIAISGANRDLQNSIFKNNRVGIFNSAAGLTNITGNTISDNDTGVVISSNTSYSNGLGTNNIICHNHVYDLLCYSLFNVSIPNNCWCDTDSLAIRSKIYDGYNNIAYGLIDFMPVINCDTTALPDSTSCDDLFAEIPSNELSIGQLKLFPNPAFDRLLIYSSEKIFQIRVFDLPGKELLLKRINAFENELGIHSFSPGIYFIQLEMKNGIVVKKFIKE